MKTRYYSHEIGLIEIKYDEKYIRAIQFVSAKTSIENEQSDLSDKAFLQLKEYFNGSRKVFDLPYIMEGTDFQKKVWRALCEIPYGETRSYKEIAIQIGKGKAARAVGSANNKNPLAIIIPCHRVISADGKLSGYAGGIEIKESLLNLEKRNLFFKDNK